MRNIPIIIVISLIATILIINTNYAFAKEQDLSQENKDTAEDCKGSDKCTIESQQDLSQKNKDTDMNSNEEDCKGSDKCTIESQQQQTNQDMSCVKSAKCINQATSHIVICKESSLCFVQYDGPFELSSPY
jgi:hypothetical protein